MRLELGKIHIKDIQFAAESKIEANVLYVNKEELVKAVFEDDAIESVDLEIARPGESVRITPVKDVIEPRVKVEGRGGIFPGILSKVDTVGEGRTIALKGMAVVTTGKIVGFQEGIIDMTGIGAEYTPFSKTNNLIVIAEPKEGIKQHEHEKAVRYIGFKAARYIAELARTLEPEEVEVYETKPLLEQIAEYPDLPKVGYVYMLQTQGLLHDTYVYGVDAKQIVPTILYPTEIMDGAIVSGNCVSERSSNWTAKLCRYLNLDAVIVSQEGFGNPDTDLIMNCKKIEAEQVKTVIVTDEYAGRDGASQSLADADVAANAVVTGGNANQVVVLPKLDKIIGHIDVVNVIAGGNQDSLREDGTIDVEIQAITGATNETGFGYLSAKTF